MIQRIQTLYIIAAVGLLIAFFFMPLAMINNHPVISQFTLFGSQDAIFTGIGNFGIIITQFLLGMVVAILTVTIFLYKKRKQQLRFCVFSIILLILLDGILCLSLLSFRIPQLDLNLRISAFFPLISAVFILMAYSAIRKDESLVKSYDRIR